MTSMPDITYYALTDNDHPAERPTGLVRRIHTEPGPTDQAFHRDLRWHPTEYLRLYALGHDGTDHVEITEEEADAVIARWRKHGFVKRPSE
jgi:hypothetical protein